jgi:universal stress protein A
MTLFRRILVPHDFSDHATRALQLAADLAAEHGGSITVLHAVTPVYSGLGFPTEADIAWTPRPDMMRALRRQLEAVVKRAVRGRVRDVQCRVVIDVPVEAILRAARRADVIVIATLGRTGLAHLFIGSVAERVVRHAPVPVLTIRSNVVRRTARRTQGARRRR